MPGYRVKYTNALGQDDWFNAPEAKTKEEAIAMARAFTASGGESVKPELSVPEQAADVGLGLGRGVAKGPLNLAGMATELTTNLLGNPVGRLTNAAGLYPNYEEDEALREKMQAEGTGLSSLGTQAADALLPQTQTKLGAAAEEIGAAGSSAALMAPAMGASIPAFFGAGLVSGAAAETSKALGAPPGVQLAAAILAMPAGSTVIKGALPAAKRVMIATRGGSKLDALDDVADDVTELVAELQKTPSGRAILERVQRQLAPSLGRTKPEALDDLAAASDDFAHGLRPSAALGKQALIREEEALVKVDRAFETMLQRNADDVARRLDPELRGMISMQGGLPRAVAERGSRLLRQSDELYNAARADANFFLSNGRIKNTIASIRSKSTSTRLRHLQKSGVDEELEVLSKWGNKTTFEEQWDAYQSLGTKLAKAVKQDDTISAKAIRDVRAAIKGTWTAAEKNPPKGANPETIKKFKEANKIRSQWHDEFGDESMLKRAFKTKRGVADEADEAVSLADDIGDPVMRATGGTRESVGRIVKGEGALNRAKELRSMIGQEKGGIQALEDDVIDFIISPDGLTRQGITSPRAFAGINTTPVGGRAGTVLDQIAGESRTGDAVAELLGGRNSAKYNQVLQGLTRLAKNASRPAAKSTGSASPATASTINPAQALYAGGRLAERGSAAFAGYTAGTATGLPGGGVVGIGVGLGVDKATRWIMGQSDEVIYRLRGRGLLHGDLLTKLMQGAPDDAFAAYQTSVTRDMVKYGVVASKEELRALGDIVRAEGQ